LLALFNVPEISDPSLIKPDNVDNLGLSATELKVIGTNPEDIVAAWEAKGQRRLEQRIQEEQRELFIPGYGFPTSAHHETPSNREQAARGDFDLPTHIPTKADILHLYQKHPPGSLLTRVDTPANRYHDAISGLADSYRKSMKPGN